MAGVSQPDVDALLFIAPRPAPDPRQLAADLAAGEPLEAAGVPPEQRLFGVTVANILQGPLVGLAPRLAAYTAPGGLLGLSGVCVCVVSTGGKRARGVWCGGPCTPLGCSLATCPTLITLPHNKPTDRLLLRRPARTGAPLRLLPGWMVPAAVPTCTHTCPPFAAAAGVLQDQTPAVIQAYSPWFEAFQVATEDRWAVVTAVRRRDAPVGAEQQRRQREAGS